MVEVEVAPCVIEYAQRMQRVIEKTQMRLVAMGASTMVAPNLAT